MSNLADRLNKLRSRYRADNNLDPIPAVLGDNQGNIVNPNVPGEVWVRLITSNGLSEPRSVRGPAGKLIALRAQNVQLERDRQGRLRIAEPDHDATQAAGVNPVSAWELAVSQRVTQDNIETLRVVPDNPPSTVVKVKAWAVIIRSVVYLFPGASIDLASLAPSASQRRYVSIFVKNDYVTLEAKASTQRSLADLPLDRVDLQETITASSPGSTPVWAIPLQNNPSTIKQADIASGIDLRNFVNSAEGGGSGAIDSILTSVTSAIFVGGNGNVLTGA